MHFILLILHNYYYTQFYWVCRKSPMEITLCSQISKNPVNTTQSIDDAEISIYFKIKNTQVRKLKLKHVQLNKFCKHTQHDVVILKYSLVLIVFLTFFACIMQLNPVCAFWDFNLNGHLRLVALYLCLLVISQQDMQLVSFVIMIYLQCNMDGILNIAEAGQQRELLLI